MIDLYIFQLLWFNMVYNLFETDVKIKYFLNFISYILVWFTNDLIMNINIIITFFRYQMTIYKQ